MACPFKKSPLFADGKLRGIHVLVELIVLTPAVVPTALQTSRQIVRTLNCERWQKLLSVSHA